jgi:hypothetical protein
MSTAPGVERDDDRSGHRRGAPGRADHDGRAAPRARRDRVRPFAGDAETEAFIDAEMASADEYADDALVIGRRHEVT